MKRPVKMLYVEDDTLDRSALERLIRERELAYELTTAATLGQARACLAQGRFDVILADYHLPDGAGSELFEEVPDTPFILLTGSLEEELALRTLQRGADDYLPKDPLQRHLEAIPLAVEKALYRQELRQAEQRLSQQLRQREEQLRLITDNTPALIAYVDGQLRYQFVNRQHEQWFGCPCEQLVGKSMAELLDSQVLERFQPRWARALAGEAVDYEDEMRLRQGACRWTEGRYIPQRDGEGQVVGFHVLIVDMTERRRAQEGLRRSEALYRTMARNIPEGALSVVDGGLRYLVAEGQLLGRLGLRKEMLEGRTVEEVFPGETGRVRAQYFRRALAGESIHYETEYEGRMVWSQFVPMRGEREEILGALSLGMDVTERRQAEEALKRMKEELARTNAELEHRVEERTAKLRETMAEMEQISYSMIHDLRAPLRAIQSFGGILAEDRDSQLSEPARELLQRMRAAAERMDHLVVDVLNYSKIVRGHLPLGPVEVGTLARNIVETYPGLEPGRAEVRLAPDLPAVQGNAAALTQCLAHLLENAVKFAQPGQRPRIEVRAEPRPDGWVRLVVEDNGIGIAPEFQEKVFGLFERLSADTEGTGMGLAIVKKAAERMGGRVGLDSREGRGSRFWLELPLAQGAVPVPQAA